jgi:hypothetical protein
MDEITQKYGEKVPCPECGGEAMIMIWQTLVGYGREPNGHYHDDNCLIARGECVNGHKIFLSKRRRCEVPGCDWVGKETCFCHSGKKIDEWPWEVKRT